MFERNEGAAPPLFTAEARAPFVATRTDQLSLQRGDRVQVLDITTFAPWWLARHEETQEEGLAPPNYLDRL